MTRYYFDLWEGSRISIDDEGAECVDLEDAVAQAKRLLPAIACETNALQNDACHLRVVVRDESGERMFEASLALIFTRLSLPDPTITSAP